MSGLEAQQLLHKTSLDRIGPRREIETPSYFSRSLYNTTGKKQSRFHFSSMFHVTIMAYVISSVAYCILVGAIHRSPLHPSRICFHSPPCLQLPHFHHHHHHPFSHRKPVPASVQTASRTGPRVLFGRLYSIHHCRNRRGRSQTYLLISGCLALGGLRRDIWSEEWSRRYIKGPNGGVIASR